MTAEATRVPHGMTPAHMAGLVDAAFRSLHPLVFLDTAVTTFEMLGRWEDATTAAWMSHLLAEGEVEILMSLRAAWRRGEARSPADAARASRRIRV